MVVETDTFIKLDKEKYMSLTTFRKTGEAVITPVWFAESKGTIYVGTGSEIVGKAQVVSEPEEISAAEAALTKKYGLTRSMYYFILNTLSFIRRKPRMKEAFIAIESVAVYTD